MPDKLEFIPTDRIFLDADNPRHEPYKSPSDVIAYLCDKEQVLELATDIAEFGLNPLEVFAVIPSDARQKKGQKANYVVAEGNRRMCALMLLNDPDLAPPKQRKAFQALADGWDPISPMPCIVFQTKEEVHPWLMRIHGGAQGGKGRRSWSSEQKTRHTGNTRNITAQWLLDYAEAKGYLTSDDRKGKITTVQRFVGNRTFREVLGLEAGEEFHRTRPEKDFDKLTERFVQDLLKANDGPVTSRHKAAEIASYARELSTLPGVGNQRVLPERIDLSPTKKSTRKPKPTKPKHPSHINYSSELHHELKAIPSYKLETLYYSICSIDLEGHVPLLSVALWAFIETLTAIAGRDSTTSFVSFLSDQRLTLLGVTDKDERKTVKSAIQRLAEYGNTTKHHNSSAHFNGPQLYNDVETVNAVLVALAKTAAQKRS